MSNGYSYILLAVDYVSKWVEAIATRTNDAKVVLEFVRAHIISRFGMPRAIISDGGSHFCNRSFDALYKKYGVNHRVSTPYDKTRPGNSTGISKTGHARPTLGEGIPINQHIFR